VNINYNNTLNDEKQLIAKSIFALIKNGENSLYRKNCRGYNIDKNDEDKLMQLLNQEYFIFYKKEIEQKKEEMVNKILNEDNRLKLNNIECNSLDKMLEIINKSSKENDVNKKTFYKNLLILKSDLVDFENAYTSIPQDFFSNKNNPEDIIKIVSRFNDNGTRWKTIYDYNINVFNQIKEEEFNNDFNDISNGLLKLKQESNEAKKETDSSLKKLDNLSLIIGLNEKKLEKDKQKMEAIKRQKKIMDLSTKLGIAYANNDWLRYEDLEKELNEIKENDNYEEIVPNKDFEEYISYLDDQIKHAGTKESLIIFQCFKDEALKTHTIDDNYYQKIKEIDEQINKR
jgi:hypothetical protein